MRKNLFVNIIMEEKNKKDEISSSTFFLVKRNETRPFKKKSKTK